MIEEGFEPVFIPDTDSCFVQEVKLDNFFVFRESSWNLGLRMALYEESYLNFVSAGPASIAQLNRKVRYISMINIILTTGEYNVICDVNEDGMLNILDVVTLVNWILN